MFEERFAYPWCPKCEVLERERLRAEDERIGQIAREERFWSEVPPLYRATDKTRLGANLVAAIDRYKFGATGLAFLGRAGEGKTRAAVLLLHRLAMEGHRTFYLPCIKLAAAAADAFSDSKADRAEAKRVLERAATTEVLLLDDLGKNRMTERAEVELYDLLEHRTGYMLPTLWTSNSSAAGLHSMFSPDRADALVRRLGKEFCEHVVL